MRNVSLVPDGEVEIFPFCEDLCVTENRIYLMLDGSGDKLKAREGKRVWDKNLVMIEGRLPDSPFDTVGDDLFFTNGNDYVGFINNSSIGYNTIDEIIMRDNPKAKKIHKKALAIYDSGTDGEYEYVVTRREVLVLDKSFRIFNRFKLNDLVSLISGNPNLFIERENFSWDRYEHGIFVETVSLEKNICDTLFERIEKAMQCIGEGISPDEYDRMSQAALLSFSDGKNLYLVTTGKQIWHVGRETTLIGVCNEDFKYDSENLHNIFGRNNGGYGCLLNQNVARLFSNGFMVCEQELVIPQPICAIAMDKHRLYVLPKFENKLLRYQIRE